MFLRGAGDVAIEATSIRLDASDRKFSQLRTREIGFEIGLTVASQSWIFCTKVGFRSRHRLKLTQSKTF